VKARILLQIDLFRDANPAARNWHVHCAFRNHGGICRMTRVLSEREAWDIINAGKLGRLGCVNDDEPYVVPINYVAIDGQIYSHSLLGRKIQTMRDHTRVCLQVDRIRDDFHWQSAIAFGNYEEIKNDSERRTILRRLLEGFPKLTPVESELTRDAEPPPIIVFRLRIDRVSGVAEE
jgi:nitroimidazol reductase NimA-like FMN-containing flavoprotein (pyridoxamine 5'-phosphate oxidase superfamily)